MRSSKLGLLIVIFFLFFLSIATFASEYPETPNTKGSLCTVRDPDFKEYRYEEKIPYCERNVSASLKAQLYEIYGVLQKDTRYYTIDHIIPLSIGGSNQPDNLWPEHKKIKNCRKDLEINTFKELRSGLITQKQAIDRIIYIKTKQVCTE